MRAWANKRDDSEPEIVAVFEAAGWSVQPLSIKGVPDLLICPPGERPLLCEVKTGNAKLTPAQEEWFRNWRGEPPHVVRTAAHARKLVRMLTAKGGGSWHGPEDVDAERAEAVRRVKGVEPA